MEKLNEEIEIEKNHEVQAVKLSEDIIAEPLQHVIVKASVFTNLSAMSVSLTIYTITLFKSIDLHCCAHRFPKSNLNDFLTVVL